MPTTQIVDRPQNNSFVSPYEPIKISARAHKNSDTLLSTHKEEFPSGLFEITPFDNVTNAELVNEKVSIRTQISIDIPNHTSSGNTPNTNYTYYTIDVSSICRDFLSFDLRPCTHDTSQYVKRDITLGKISNNLYRKFRVEFILERIDSDGNLVTTADKDFCIIHVSNSALLHEEEHFGVVSSVLHNNSQPTQSSQLYFQYTHRQGTNFEKNRQKYLTTKPTSKRIIGTDECEYITFINQTMPNSDGTTNNVRVTINFYDFNNSLIATNVGLGDGTTSDKSYALIANNTVRGDGVLGSGLDSWGGTSFLDEDLSVCQVGVGTRNIKETNALNFNDDLVVSDFSNIKYYEVFTEISGNVRIGETITYVIDHKRRRKDGVRFHWQNRLGGIDSYTFDGAFSESINISSKTYEQSIYPMFRGQLGANLSTTNMQIGGNQPYFEDFGAVVPRVAGLTDDKYQSIRKSKVKAFKEGTAISRPYGFEEQDMIEDLLSSQNVCIEKGWRSKEVFKEDWSGYGDVSNITDNWDVIDGDFTTDGSFRTNDGHLTGTRTYGKGDNDDTDDTDGDLLWTRSKSRIPYNPKNLYEIEVRIKSSGSGEGFDDVGFIGYAADATTRIDTNGNATNNPPHRPTLSSHDQTANDKFEVFRGYVTGHASSGTIGAEAHDPKRPSVAREGIKFISPFFRLHNVSNKGITQIDYIKVTEHITDIPNAKKFYSTLNRNYYRPIVIKDSTMTTFDNENLQTCTLNYVESKNKRTIE